MKLKLAHYSDPILRKKVERVNFIDDDLRRLVDDMIETMHALNGIGLAAPQVFRSIALFITNVPKQLPNGKWVPGQPRVFLNPQIVEVSEEMQTISEGCLSIPNLYMNVTRPKEIKIQATDINGHPIEETLSDFEATNFLHEYDHLNGILIIDYYSPEERKSLELLFKSSRDRL
jgi:peptide deformylase